MLVVGDTEDPFPPLPDDHYVTLETSRHVVDHLLQNLHAAFETTTTLDTAMGAALQVWLHCTVLSLRIEQRYRLAGYLQPQQLYLLDMKIQTLKTSIRACAV